MAVYTSIDAHTLNELVADYGLGTLVGSTGVPQGSVNTNYFVEASNGAVVVRIDEVKGELDVKREIELLLYLRKEGYACPEPLADRRGRYYRTLQGKCLSMYRRIAGQQHGPGTLSVAQVEDAGRVLAELHAAGKSYKKAIDNRFGFERIVHVYRQLRAKLPPHFRRIVRTLDDEVGFLREYLETKLPKGVIHGDLFEDNLIYQGDKVVGVLDFEAAGRGKLVYDLAVAANALCYTPGRGYDIKRFDALMLGYETLRPLSLAEWDAFPNELRYSALRFTVTRLRDFHLRPVGEKARVDKDFAEFYERLQILRREREGGMDALLMAMATGYDYRKYQRGRGGEGAGLALDGAGDDAAVDAVAGTSGVK